MSEEKKRIPVREGLWISSGTPEKGPRLVASRCSECGEIFFPRKDNGVCTQCQSVRMEEILLGTGGKIYSYTVIMQRPPVYYQGEVPYAIGFVELPEGVRVQTLFSIARLEDLRVGMDVEMVVEKLSQDDQGHEVLSYKFRPVEGWGAERR